MNILIITQYFWPESFRNNDVIAGLRERVHDVTVLTGIPNYPAGKFFPGYTYFNKRMDDYQGIRVRRVPILPRGKGGTIKLIINYLSFMLGAAILGPFYCRKRYDLIFFSLSPFTEGIPAIIFKKLHRAKAVYWAQDIWPESLSSTGTIRSGYLLRLIQYFIRMIYSNCDMVLMQSRVFTSYIEREGISKEKIRYFPNSAEELYKQVTLPRDAPEHSLMPTGFRIVFAGNIGAAQDFGTILSAAEAIREYKDIHWVIIGDGRLRSWVEDQVKIRNLSDTVHLIGRYPVEDMPRFFSLADALLVTLKKEPIFALTIPGKVQSYLACARPIIAALDGEGARIVDEAGAGLSCPAENPEQLSQTVLKLYHMSGSERDRMARNGREYFERNFERNVLLDKLDGLLLKLCEVRK
jgi:colanic acid biosynthesis glycosyl transferase WcaI